MIRHWFRRGSPRPLLEPSYYYGDEILWGPGDPSDPHNPMMDAKGRVWMTSTIRAPSRAAGVV